MYEILIIKNFPFQALVPSIRKQKNVLQHISPQYRTAHLHKCDIFCIFASVITDRSVC